MMRSRSLALLLVCGLALSARAQTVPAGFTATDINEAEALDDPTAMAIAPDGRIFVCQQGGALRVVDPLSGALGTFHTFAGLSTLGERGLIGVTFDPGFAQNGFVYAYVTRVTPNEHNVVVRLKASSNPSVSDGTETDLLPLNGLGANIHNGGALHFGPDGKLYIAVGDNGVSGNAQSIGTLLGKILRINPDGSIPVDNPTSISGIAGSPTGANRAIWAAGLRNPFTMGFQPGTGRLFVNDVGQNTWEEINEGQAGGNYGWSATEGDFVQASFPNFTRPFSSYSHTSGPFIVGDRRSQKGG